MSIDFSQDPGAPLITTSFTPADEQEYSLRPKRLSEYNGQEKVKENLLKKWQSSFMMDQIQQEKLILEKAQSCEL